MCKLNMQTHKLLLIFCFPSFWFETLLILPMLKNFSRLPCESTLLAKPTTTIMFFYMYWIKGHLPKKQGTLSHCQQIKNHFPPFFLAYSWVELHKIAKTQIQSLCFKKILLTFNIFFIFLTSGSNTGGNSSDDNQ